MNTSNLSVDSELNEDAIKRMIKQNNEQSILLEELGKKSIQYQDCINNISEKLLYSHKENKKQKEEYQDIINELYTSLYNELRENEKKIIDYQNTINELYASLSKTKTKKYCPYGKKCYRYRKNKCSKEHNHDYCEHSYNCDNDYCTRKHIDYNTGIIIHNHTRKKMKVR